MTVEMIETLLRRAGGLMAFASLGVILYGIWRGTGRPPGRVSGQVAGWQRSAAFYLLATALLLAFSTILWKPLPLPPSPGMEALALTFGTFTYFPGLACLLWGRAALGEMYFVSTAFGAELFANHQLVSRGPFAFVRHPMYLGLIVAAVGSLLLYRTWTTAAFAVFAPFILVRARREEQALAAEFGEEWQAYAARTRFLIPFVY